MNPDAKILFFFYFGTVAVGTNFIYDRMPGFECIWALFVPLGSWAN